MWRLFWIMISWYDFLYLFRSFSHSPASLLGHFVTFEAKMFGKIGRSKYIQNNLGLTSHIFGLLKRKLLSLFEDVYIWHGVRRFYVGLPWFILIVIVRGLNWNGLGLAMKYLSANQIKLNMCTSFFPRWVPSTQITF